MATTHIGPGTPPANALAHPWHVEGQTRICESRSIGELLAGLRACETESQMRQWLRDTFKQRISLPERMLRYVETERAQREAMLAEKRRSEIVNARAKAIKEGRGCESPRYRGGTGEGDPVLLHGIRKVLKKYNLSPSRFGRDAANDPRLVIDLEAGREPRAKTKERVLAYIASLEGRS